MPLELGVFIGAKRFGDPKQRRKRALVLDTEKYRYQKFMSDIAGQDIKSHGGDPITALKEVVNWLRGHSRSKAFPGGNVVATEFAEFEIALPLILQARALHREDMTFGDYVSIVAGWATALR